MVFKFLEVTGFVFFIFQAEEKSLKRVRRKIKNKVCVCVHACVRACVRVCVCACVHLFLPFYVRVHHQSAAITVIACWPGGLSGSFV